MQDQIDFFRLVSEHDTIDAGIDALKRLTTAAEMDLEAVLAALATLSVDLREHLAHEDSFIYPMMIEQDRTNSHEVAQSFVSEFAALRADWNAYLAEWTADCIEADWGNFCWQTASMMTRLGLRVMRENEVLYLRALQNGRIRLRETKPVVEDACEAAIAA